MLVIVSPAKRLDEKAMEPVSTSQPVFYDHAMELAQTARKLTGPNLEKLMRISQTLGALNVKRFAVMGTGQGEKPAIQMFSGDTYAGLDAASLDDDELRYAQDHLSILSGLYGLLRPNDMIAPHRLEMGTRMQNSRGKDLYAFWGSRISKALNERARETGSGFLVNCASVEYFSAVQLDVLEPKVITPRFLNMKSGQPKNISFYAKKARGAMARYIVQNRLRDPESLKEFNLGGYQYQSNMSEGDELVFLRDEVRN